MRIIFIAFSICCLLLGCHSKKAEYRKLVGYWEGREIIFPNLPAKYCRRDTVYSEVWKKPYKILHYIDTLGCTACRLRLFEWQKFLSGLDSISQDVGYIFVLGLRDYSEFEYQQIVNGFDWPVFYDSRMQLDSLNHLPVNPLLQTFLLDSSNQVIAIGDPIRNKAVSKLYKDIVSGQIVL